ncbi:endonuclease [Candidatus Wolfebacteria bacterium]|nr:MAG: endonuclease [Candidatus Wolfebacteria bacterium]
MVEQEKYIVYAIYNKVCEKIYIGQTEDLQTRLRLHNDKTFKQSYTSRFSGEWEIIYTEELESRQKAVIREKQLKSYRGRDFLKQYIPQ